MNTIHKQKVKSTLNKLKLLLLIGVLFSCENDLAEVEKYDTTANIPIQTAKEVEILYSTEGNVVFQLNAPVLHQFQNETSYNEMPEGVEVKIFDTLMTVTTKLIANYAIDSTDANKMEAKDDVVVINEKGEMLNTEHLVWDKKTEKITSDVYVKITTKDQILMGDGLIANQDFSEYRILHPHGILNIDK